MSRRPPRGRFMLLATVAAVMVTAAWYMVASEAPASDDLSVPSFLTGVALVAVIPGLVAEWRRPRGPVAWLVVAVGLAPGVGAFRLLRPSWAATLGAAVFYGLALAGCDLLLRLPDGRRSQHRLPVLTACWLVPGCLAVAVLLVTGPSGTTAGLHAGGMRATSWMFRFAPDNEPARWFRQGNPLHVFDSDFAARFLWVSWSVLILTVVWTTAVIMARRCAAAPRGERRTARLLRAGAIAMAVGATAQPIAAYPERVAVVLGPPHGSVLQGHWFVDLVDLAPALAAGILGAILLWIELVRPRLGRESNGAIPLDPVSSPTSVSAQVERALGDPTARVLFARDDGTWVDDLGRLAQPASVPGRAATVVTREGVSVAAVEHDDWLLTQPDLVDVTVASVALTLEGRRLAALAKATTDDIQASAVRLLNAAEHARQTVERRISEGPEQTLARVSALLGTDPVPIHEVHQGLRAAVAEVRDIAHGIAPTRLAEDGLAAALVDLAAESDADILVAELPAVTLPLTVETTILLVAQDAARDTSGPLNLAVTLGSLADHRREIMLRVDGWAGPLDQLVVDRIATLGGSVTTSEKRIDVALPVPDED